MRNRNLIFAAPLLLALAGCSSLTDMVIQNPTYAFRDIRPRVAFALPLSASTIDIDFDIEVRNPNPVGLRLDRVDFDVLVNDSRLVRSASTQQVRIPAEGTGSVHLTTRIGYQEIRSIFREVADIIQGDRARYEMRGTAHFNTPVGRMQFPLTIYQSGR